MFSKQAYGITKCSQMYIKYIIFIQVNLIIITWQKVSSKKTFQKIQSWVNENITAK